MPANIDRQRHSPGQDDLLTADETAFPPTMTLVRYANIVEEFKRYALLD